MILTAIVKPVLMHVCLMFVCSVILVSVLYALISDSISTGFWAVIGMSLRLTSFLLLLSILFLTSAAHG